MLTSTPNFIKIEPILAKLNFDMVLGGAVGWVGRWNTTINHLKLWIKALLSIYHYHTKIHTNQIKISESRVMAGSTEDGRVDGGWLKQPHHFNFQYVPTSLWAALSVGQSVGQSVRQLVGPSVADYSEHATYGDRPCF